MHFFMLIVGNTNQNFINNNRINFKAVKLFEPTHPAIFLLCGPHEIISSRKH